MRIAFVGTGMAALSPGSGALERVVLGWSEGLEERGYEVTLVEWGTCTGPTLTTSEESRLRDALASVPADIFIMNNRPMWATLTKTPVLQILHNYPDAWWIDRSSHREVAEVLDSQHVAAVSPTLAKFIISTYQLAECPTVHVPVEQLFFTQIWSPIAKRVVFPNRLMEKKGVAIAVEAAAELSTDGWEFFFFQHIAPFLEPTEEHRRLSDLVRGSPGTRLSPPPITREDMASILASAQVAICPSIKPEGLGLSMLEAQAVGTAVVASDAGGLVDAVFPPNRCVPTGNVPALVEAIIAAGSRSDNNNARKAVEARYAAEAAATSLEQLLDLYKI
jgi:glycosyltransferase involved in cell wall biosynthesis